MSYIPASYDHFRRSYVFVKLGHFWLISRKSHFGRFVDMWHLGRKNYIPLECNFFAEEFSGKCLLGSYAWEILGFRSKTEFKMFLQHFEIRDLAFFDDFCSISEPSKCCKNTRSQISKCCKNFLNHVFSTKTKISHAYEPNRHFPEDTSAKKLFPL